MSDEQMNDSTFSRLFILMVLAMTIMTVVILLLASVASNDVNARLDERNEVENSTALANRIAPVGKFAAKSAKTRQVAAPIVLTGQEAYTSCAACHDAGVAGAPTLGDAAAWSDRIAQGAEILYEHAINGYQGKAGYMPAKGGNMSLSDASVRAAVDYMLEQTTN